MIPDCYRKHAVILDIRSWTGLSIGAEHFYGSLQCNRERKELKRPLPKQEAEYLNKKDSNVSEFFFLREGDETNRFSSEQDVCDRAAEVYKEIFPHAVVLVYPIGDAQAGKILAGLDDIQDQANGIWQQCEDLGWWDNKENVPIVEELNDSWFELVGDAISKCDLQEVPDPPESKQHQEKAVKSEFEETEEDDQEEEIKPEPEEISEEPEDDDEDWDEPTKYLHPKDMPSEEMVVPIHVEEVNGEHCWGAGKECTGTKETFYLMSVSVTDENDNEIGYINGGLDGRVVIKRGDTRLIIWTEELWEAACKVIDKVESAQPI